MSFLASTRNLYNFSSHFLLRYDYIDFCFRQVRPSQTWLDLAFAGLTINEKICKLDMHFDIKISIEILLVLN